MKKLCAAILGLVMLCAAPTAALAGPAVGQAAPGFRVTSGDGKHARLGDFGGKVLIIFYEDKDKVEVNRALKDALKQMFNPAVAARLAVVDASSAGFFTRGIWEDKLVEASGREGMTIHGDWDGSMKRAYGLAQGKSNFLIVCKKGKIRYVASGKIPPDQVPVIKRLLVDLAAE